MIKVHIYSESVLQKWDGSCLELSRVPCVGEWVRTPGYSAFEVLRVIHHVDADDGTVAGLTLKA